MLRYIPLLMLVSTVQSVSAQVTQGSCTSDANSPFEFNPINTKPTNKGRVIVDCQYALKQSTSDPQLVRQDSTLWADCPSDKPDMVGSGYTYNAKVKQSLIDRPILITVDDDTSTSVGVDRHKMAFYFDKGIMDDVKINVRIFCE